MSMPSTKPAMLFLFGPQFSSLDLSSLHNLRRFFAASPSLQWVGDALKTLPYEWTSACERITSLQSRRDVGKCQLEKLVSWFRTGTLALDDSPLPNITLTVLAVISHLVQYGAYMEGLDSNEVAVETLGFCTGLLSSFAVAGSRSLEGLKIWGPVAIRLAMLVGGTVDAQDIESRIFAAAWTTPESKLKFLETLNKYPTAYVSVWPDENRATVTAESSAASQLQSFLHSVGIITADVNLAGFFHAESSRPALEELLTFCDNNHQYQLPDAAALAIPAYSNSQDGHPLEGRLDHVALRSILVDRCDWYTSFARASKYSHAENSVPDILVFGSERCIPPSTQSTVAHRVTYVADDDSVYDGPRPTGPDDIAVVGMSIKVAGADDLNDFWKILLEGRSQHVEVPSERFSFNTPFRGASSKKYYGNFIRDHDAFDHRFFKKSPREAEWADPQQRWMLQLAYQTLEQSGYFSSPSTSDREKHQVGCYIGVCARDYEDNIASHEAGTFGATGTLQSFIAGKVSHHFGWTGPSMTIDTACSASGVAIHLACNAIRSGDCTAALVGGALVFTSPAYFQNLAAASFLSPTGQCKPFDAAADGYCRGEGVAAVFLKKLSDAVADGDQVLGIIASTSVQQNESSTPIFVPNTESLTSLFRTSLQKAKLKPSQISVVEAHGTGTAVGDPVEYESIASVLGQGRSQPVICSSVKGVIGHTECVSGLVSLIKAILMMHYCYIPRQASFNALSPAMKAAGTLNIPLQAQPWKTKFRAALINNYGASGSNTCMVVTQGPVHRQSRAAKAAANERHPFRISGYDDRSLRAYCKKLLDFFGSAIPTAKETYSLPELSYSVCRQFNPSLPRSIVWSCSTMSELELQIKSIYCQENPSTHSIETRRPTRPVVLCFGGQVSTFVGLDRQLVDECCVFRKHLDICNEECTKVGLESIYPAIYQRTPIADPLVLHPLLFCLQYACAKAWIDCGVRPAALVGHSFGELTALCISGVLSLRDTLKLIAGRAQLLRDSWGQDTGAMVAIEASQQHVEELLNAAHEKCPNEDAPSIACFNGPESFTVAGSSKAIDVFQELAVSSSARVIRLNVTHAFHCSLTEPLITKVEALAQSLVFRDAVIPLETATAASSSGRLAPSHIVHHLKMPVYFSSAIQRLARRFSSAVWVEAGSKSTITNMARRALSSSVAASHHFQPINITSDDSFSRLADCTTALWKAGMNVTFWAHYISEAPKKRPIFLPPYQFDKSKHWLPLREPPYGDRGLTSSGKAAAAEKGLVTFRGWQDKHGRQARFQINTSNTEYLNYMNGHDVIGTAPICPASLQIRLVLDAAASLQPKLGLVSSPSLLSDTKYLVPVCHDLRRAFWIDLLIEPSGWEWTLSSSYYDAAHSAVVVHASGQLSYAPGLEDDFARFERLVKHRAVGDLFANHDAEIISGPVIYKLFAEIVNYSDMYRLLRSVARCGDSSAARINVSPSARQRRTWFKPLLSDNICQAAGFVVNCMADYSVAGEVYLATAIDKWICSPSFSVDDHLPSSLDVYVTHHRPTEDRWICDVFVFHPSNGALMEVVLGLEFRKTSKASLTRLLRRFSPQTSEPASREVVRRPSLISWTEQEQEQPKPNQSHIEIPCISKSIVNQVRTTLAAVSGIDFNQIKADSRLGPLGLDSLTITELSRCFKQEFGYDLRKSEDLTDSTTVAQLAERMQLLSHSIETSRHYTHLLPAGTVEQSTVHHPTSDRSLAELQQNRKSEFVQYLTDFLGVSSTDMSRGLSHRLGDIGLDSLLSTELRHDIERRYGVYLASDMSLGDLTASQLEAAVTFSSNLSRSPSSAPSTQQHEDGDIDELSSASEASTTVSRAMESPIHSDLDTEASAAGDLDIATREAVALGYIREYISGLIIPDATDSTTSRPSPEGSCVLITGATGSLGAQLAARWARIPTVSDVICLNRPRASSSSTQTPLQRQLAVFTDAGIVLSPACQAKLRVYASDTAQPFLGLSAANHAALAASVTHIVHNAWPMTLVRPVAGFEAQFATMRNLLDLAAAAATKYSRTEPVVFQFVSSVAVVARHPPQQQPPLGSGGSGTRVPLEEHATGLGAAMPCGYADAKWVCERMLATTLGTASVSATNSGSSSFPRRFRASVVRLAQISGSRDSGHWRSSEHVPALLRSAQTLGVLPALEGSLAWLPVDVAAAVLVELARNDEASSPVYHVENPVRQQWKDMVALWGTELGLGEEAIVSFEEWLRRVKEHDGPHGENPAVQLLGFLENDFVRNACGELILDTSLARRDSPALVSAGAVTPDLGRRYVASWRESGHLA